MKITLDYLKGIVDALYYAQTPLLGGEIEDEKNFQINAYKGFFGFDVRLTSTENYKRAKFENDLHEDIMYIQVIDLGKDVKVSKLVKDIVTEMEVIYKMDCPKVIDQGCQGREFIG